MKIFSELFEDMDNTCVVPSCEVGSIGSAYSKTGQVYLDSVAIYIEKFFITKPPYLFSTSVVVQVCQAPCNEDQPGNFYQKPLTGLFLSLVKNSERTKLLEQFLA